jgi:hypothetical protein
MFKINDAFCVIPAWAFDILVTKCHEEFFRQQNVVAEFKAKK